MLLVLLAASICFAQNGYQKPLIGRQINWGNPLSRGLVAWWVMNEGCGPRVYDSSGNQNTGTVYYPVWRPRSGRLGYVLGGWDGVGTTYTIIPYKPILEATRITVSVWIMGTVAAGEFMLVAKFPDYSSRSWILEVADGILKLYISSNGSTWDLVSNLGTRLVIDSIWHQCVFTYDQSMAKIYVDGVLNASGGIAGTIFAGANPIEIGSTLGGSYTSSSNYFDHVMIWNRALSAGEVAQLYLDQFGMFRPSFDITKMLLPSGQVISINR